MAKLLRDILSELATDVKALNLDDRISFRYLHSKFNSKLDYFFRLEARSREILKDFNIWKPINCINLIDVPTNCCGYIDNCNSLKMSDCDIPEAFNTNYGQLLKILTVDGRFEFKIIKSNEYNDYVTREYVRNNRICWLENKRLYVPNNTVETVKALIIPKNPIDVDKLNCTVTACASPLDATVTYSDYLISLAKREVLNELLPTKRIPEDEKGDDNTNIKV